MRLPDLQLTRGAELHGHRLRLAIDPPELGGCKLELTLRGDQVRATVIAERADTLAALRDAEPQIRQALAQRGIELAGYDVGGDFGRGRQEPGAMPRQWTGLTQTSGARPGGLAGDTVRLLGRAHAGRIDLVA
ncbi:MAG TPA: flagellar hook-length control protein FliK [Armatimonadota bacterium]|nr:flagellar hook-length control protein FliK [Armatimonadota bacterium]